MAAPTAKPTTGTRVDPDAPRGPLVPEVSPPAAPTGEDLRKQAAAAQAEADRLKAEADAATAKEVEAADVKPEGHAVRVEGGGWAVAKGPIGEKEYRVLGADGGVYEHVSEHPSGDWVYRRYNS